MKIIKKIISIVLKSINIINSNCIIGHCVFVNYNQSLSLRDIAQRVTPQLYYDDSL